MRAALALSVLVCACSAVPPRPASPHAVAKQDEIPESEACHLPSDCVLVQRDPCACGPLGTSAFRARSATWAASHPPGGSTSCPDCAAEHDPGVFATCRADRCRVATASARSLTRCDADADCTVVHADCCDCPGGAFVALAADRTERYYTMRCGGPMERSACPACAGPTPPADATCVEGRCSRPSGGVF